jgi:hypothetical protein
MHCTFHLNRCKLLSRNNHPIPQSKLSHAQWMPAQLFKFSSLIFQPHFIGLKFWKKAIIIFVALLYILNEGFAQISIPGKEQFFSDEGIIEMNITADFKTLIRKKRKDDFKMNYQTAQATLTFPGSASVTDSVEIRCRGKYRREVCSMPPLLINFKKNKTSQFAKLGTMKLVWPCENNSYYEQLILKEYLVYKMYNLLTEKSFRVRLVRIEYHDSKEKIKPHHYYAFFLEDIDAVAKRNKGKQFEIKRINSWDTNREQMTLVALFEYMIGNCDWTVPISRNVKLIRSKTDTLSKPFVIPYDFDYSGLVNASYAIPPTELPIKYVQERYYLGFTRTLDELKQTLQLFKNNQQAMDSLIINQQLLEPFHKKDMRKFLKEFFEIIEKDSDIKRQFINNAIRN